MNGLNIEPVCLEYLAVSQTEGRAFVERPVNGRSDAHSSEIRTSCQEEIPYISDDDRAVEDPGGRGLAWEGPSRIGGGEVIPPNGNTGVELRVGVDWATGSIEQHVLGEFKRAFGAWVEAVRGEVVEWTGWGRRRFYQASEKWESVLLQYDLDEKYGTDTHKGRCCLEFAGGFFDTLDREQLVSWGALLNRFGFRASRLDTYVDDVHKTVGLDTVRSAIRAGQLRGFRPCSCDTRESFDRARKGEGTITFGNRGSRGSGKALCWYDKEAESKGREKGNRLEMRWYDEKAAEVWAGLVGFGFSGYDIAARVFGGLRFITDPECHRREEMEDVAWWGMLQKGIENIQITAGKAVSTVVGKMEWVRVSVAKSLAFIKRFKVAMDGTDKGFGAWLELMIEQGEERLRSWEERRIANEVREYRGGASVEGVAM